MVVELKAEDELSKLNGKFDFLLCEIFKHYLI